MSFPESGENKILDLTLSDDLLPADIKADKPDIVSRAKAEWQFVIASNKMFQTYLAEVEDLTDKVNSLSSFSDGVWEEMKGYWSKVQKQVFNRNLYGNHIDVLRKKTDVVFDKLKDLRKQRDKVFREDSGDKAQVFMDKLNAVGERIEKGLGLRPIFEELKSIQRDFNKSDMVREHKNNVYNKLDGLFKQVKDGLFGETASGSSPQDKLKRRHDGLLNAIKKMERSIKRDEDDLFYENKRKENSHGQLEDQLREAKLIMIQERLNSKRNKLEDMHKTKESIESRIAKLKEKEEEEKRKAELKQARKKVAAEIKEDIARRQEELDEDKLRKAAATIKKTSKPQAKADTLMDDVAAIAALAEEEE